MLLLWLLTGPELKPINYKTYGVIQQPVYELRVNNAEEMKQRLVDVWKSAMYNV